MDQFQIAAYGDDVTTEEKMGLTMKKIFNGILIIMGLITKRKLFTL
ncbi:MAG: hypothetical protein CM15mP23_13240 [Cryomorphaceae bacterium]|nr:MAG: hypothetical protein CM15mP23_13240 [Cryomorphaceae bacterium]